MNIFRPWLVAVATISTSAASAQALNYDRLAEKPFSIARSHHLVALVDTTDKQKLIAGLDFWQKHGREWEKDLVEEWEDSASDSREEVEDIFGRLTKFIKLAFESEDPEISNRALRTLGSLFVKAEGGCYPAGLVSLLGGRRSPDLGSGIWLGILRKKNAKELQALTELLRDPDPQLVYYALSNLELTGELQKHQPYLRSLLISPNPLLRAMAAWHQIPSSELEAVQILGPWRQSARPARKPSSDRVLDGVQIARLTGVRSPRHLRDRRKPSEPFASHFNEARVPRSSSINHYLWAGQVLERSCRCSHTC